MEQQAVIDFFDQAAAGWDAQLVRNEAVIGQILDNAGTARRIGAGRCLRNRRFDPGLFEARRGTDHGH